MKRSVFLILLISSVTSGWTQDRIGDSLAMIVENSGSDDARLTALNSIADAYKVSDPARAKKYGLDELKLARNLKNKLAEGEAGLNLGNASIVLGDYRAAMGYFVAAQQVFENERRANPNNNRISKSLAKAYGSIGIIFAEQSNYARALQFHLRSVKLYEEAGDKTKCAQVYNNIGVAYKSRGEDRQALKFFLKACAIQQQVNDPQIGITLTNIANSYLKRRETGKAFEYYQRSKAALDKNRDARGLGEWYNNIGLYYLAIKDPAKAIESWNSAITTFKGIGDKFGTADTYLYLGQAHLAQGNAAAALSDAENVIKLSNELGILEQTVAAEKLLSGIYEKQLKPGLALQHFKRYSSARDSLNSVERIRKGVESEMNFEFDKREALQKKEIEKKQLLFEAQARQHKIELFFGGILLLLTAGIGFMIYNRRQLKRRMALEKSLAEYEQKALHLQMNPHFLFNCLGSISSFIVKNGKESAVRYLAKFSKLMRLTLEFSKESLIPIDKEIQSLQNYLELEQLRFNHKFTFTITKDKAIEDDMALPPLLLQPFVENAIIHGVVPSKDPGEIKVAFKLDGKSLFCTVTDNGIGYAASREIKERSVPVHESMALGITAKRLEMIGFSTSQRATVSIDDLNSSGQKGTKVTLHLPIQYVSKITAYDHSSID